MDRYLLIESLDPFDSNDVQSFYDLAASLRRDGSEVTLFLVQNGVLAARKSARSNALETVAKEGVEVLADEFSLRERGVATNRLVPGVTAAPLDVVIDRLTAGHKALWH